MNYGLPYYGDEVTPPANAEGVDTSTLPTGLSQADDTDYITEYGPWLSKLLLGGSAEEDYETALAQYRIAQRDCAAGKSAWLETVGLGPCSKATKLGAQVKALKAQAEHDKQGRLWGTAYKAVGIVALLGVSTALILRLTRKD